MILINLLPHREAARKRRREAFFVQLGLAAILPASADWMMGMDSRPSRSRPRLPPRWTASRATRAVP